MLKRDPEAASFNEKLPFGSYQIKHLLHLRTAAIAQVPYALKQTDGHKLYFINK